MSRKQGGWESACSEGSMEYFINPPPCKKTIHYNKKNRNKSKKIKKQISVLAEKLDKTWREKLQSKIKEDSETIKKMFELMDREEIEKLQAEEERKQARKKAKFNDEEEEEDDEGENDETMSSFSNDQDDEDGEINNKQYGYNKSKHSPLVGSKQANCVIKEIDEIENIGNWDVILSDEEEDDDWNDNYATVSDNTGSKENIQMEKTARGRYKDDEQVLQMSETETDDETVEEDISSKSEENEKESDEEQEECVVIVEESDDETDDEEAENYIVEQEEEENWEEDDEDEEKKAKLEERMSTLSETLEKLKAELNEARQAVAEEKKTIVLPGHVCTIAEPCTVAAQLEERLRARREAAAASYCEGLQQVERMVSQEIIRLEEDMNKLQPLNKIAADWELPQDSKLKSIMYRQDYMLVTDMTLNIPSGLKPYLKSEINEVN